MKIGDYVIFRGILANDIDSAEFPYKSLAFIDSFLDPKSESQQDFCGFTIRIRNNRGNTLPVSKAELEPLNCSVGTIWCRNYLV